MILQIGLLLFLEGAPDVQDCLEVFLIGFFGLVLGQLFYFCTSVLLDVLEVPHETLFILEDGLDGLHYGSFHCLGDSLLVSKIQKAEIIGVPA